VGKLLLCRLEVCVLAVAVGGDRFDVETREGLLRVADRVEHGSHRDPPMWVETVRWRGAGVAATGANVYAKISNQQEQSGTVNAGTERYG
jgi:hypothetical protein